MLASVDRLLALVVIEWCRRPTVYYTPLCGVLALCKDLVQSGLLGLWAFVD